jgi:hypothetical protein
MALTTHPPTNAEVKERVELYLYITSGPSWPVLGRTKPQKSAQGMMPHSKQTWEDQTANDEITSKTSEQRDGIVTSSVLCEKIRRLLNRSISVADVLAFNFRQSDVTEFSY